MEIRILYVVSFIAMLLVGCKSGAEQKIITIDVTANYSEKEIALREIADVKYIPLETKEGFYIGGSIFYADDNRIIVLEHSTGAIVIFDEEGRAVRVINHKGRGPQEYSNTHSFFFDSDNMEFFIYDRSKICVYGYDGNFKRSLPIIEGERYEEIGNFNSSTIICYNKGVISTSTDNNDNTPFLLISKADGTLIYDIDISFEKAEYPSLRFTLADGRTAVFTYGSENNIVEWGDDYLLNEISLDTIYKIDRSDLSIKPFITRIPKIHSMDISVLLHPILEVGRYIFMMTVEIAYNPDTQEAGAVLNLVYDKSDGKSYYYKLYNEDVTDKRGLSIDQRYGDYIARLYPAVSLVKRYEEGVLTGELAEIASKLDENDNPVVLLAKLKSK